MDNKKRFPLAIMLLAGLITAVITYLRHFSLIHFLWALLASLIIFYILGTVLANIMTKFEEENRKAEEKAKEEAEANEGAVIEKETVPEEKQDSQEES